MKKTIAGLALGLLTLACGPATAGDDVTIAKCIYNATPPTAVDGTALPLQCDTNGVLQTSGAGGGGGGDAVAIGSTTSGESGTLVQGAVTAAAPTYTTGKTEPLSLTAAGDLRAVISNTAFAANAGTNLNTSALALDATLGTTNTDLGPPGATACTTDTGSCSHNALLQRVAQRLTTINTTLGSPLQAGGSIAGTVTANAGTNLNTSALAVESGGNLATIANSLGGCAGQTVANTTATAINNAGSATNLKLVSKVLTKKVYICSINLVAGAATNVALVEGTKTTNECDTSTAGLAGGATAATGWNLAANGGIGLGSGTGIVAKSASANTDVCLLFSAGNQVSGTIVWAQF